VHIEQIRTGGDRNLGYLVADETTGTAAVIDPSYAPDRLVEAAAQRNLRITRAFCTHDHPDHTNGNAAFEQLTGVRPLLYGDTDPDTGRPIRGGTVLPLGSLEIEILHTPGHSPGAICVYWPERKVLVTGDLLFYRGVGRTDFPGGDGRQLIQSIEKVRRLDVEILLPGHGDMILGKNQIQENFTFIEENYYFSL